MNKVLYKDLIENGIKLDNGTIRIIIPCSPLAIKYHNDGLREFLNNNIGYKLINLQYHNRVRKLIGYVKEEK